MLNENDTTLSKLYEESFKSINEGDIIKGKIVSINPKEVLVDVGFKSEGAISLFEFPNPQELEVGKEIEVYIESKEDDNGMIVLSREKAEKLKGWDRITKSFKEGDLVEGRLKTKVKGGFFVDIFGIDAFLPASLSSFKGVPDKEIVNKIFKFQILKVNNLRKSLIVSRKDALHKEKEETKTKLWQDLKIGEIRCGFVKGIADFGAFIDLGGVDGLLHITDMSWSRISHPSEILAIGDKIEVMVLTIDKDTTKVSLGLKQRSPDPWQDIETKFPIGSRLKGKIVNILNYGVFVELEKGIEGLIHISEISWQKRINDPKELFAIGDIVEVSIFNIDKDSRRISLSIKQLEANPWLEAKDKYPLSVKVSGKVKGFADYGVFVELDDNIEGMIHISDISWTKKVSHPQDVFKKGQKIEVVVLSVDADNSRISLGYKQLLPNPWTQIAEEFPVNSILDAEVTSITSFGVFVKLKDDLEGLIYSQEIDNETLEKLKHQDIIQVKVIKVDVEQAKIGLSAKL